MHWVKLCKLLHLQRYCSPSGFQMLVILVVITSDIIWTIPLNLGWKGRQLGRTWHDNHFKEQNALTIHCILKLWKNRERKGKSLIARKVIWQICNLQWLNSCYLLKKMKEVEERGKKGSETCTLSATWQYAIAFAKAKGRNLPKKKFIFDIYEMKGHRGKPTEKVVKYTSVTKNGSTCFPPYTPSSSPIKKNITTCRRNR